MFIWPFASNSMALIHSPTNYKYPISLSLSLSLVTNNYHTEIFCQLNISNDWNSLWGTAIKSVKWNSSQFFFFLVKAIGVSIFYMLWYCWFEFMSLKQIAVANQCILTLSESLGAYKLSVPFVTCAFSLALNKLKPVGKYSMIMWTSGFKPKLIHLQQGTAFFPFSKQILTQTHTPISKIPPINLVQRA